MRVFEHFSGPGCLSHVSPTLTALPDQGFGGESESQFEEVGNKTISGNPRLSTGMRPRRKPCSLSPSPSSSPLSVRFGPMSVHGGHRIFHYRGTIVCIKCVGCSMWVIRKLRCECPRNCVWRSSGS